MQVQRVANRDFLAEAAAGLLLVAALLFGGGSRGLGDLVVHLCALPAALLALLRWRQDRTSRAQRAFLYLLMAALALVALQLVPLPAAWISQLPQRAGVLRDLKLAGLQPDWLPIALDRWGSVRSLLALGTFISMWGLATTLSASARLRLLKLALLVSAPLVLLGFAQVAGGQHVDLQFHSFQNVGSATGSFANHNHFASLLAMLAPFAIAFGYLAQREHRLGWAAAWYATTVLVLLGSALTFSRAGVVLASLAAAAAAVLVWRDRAARIGTAGRSSARAALLVTLGLTALAVAHYAWNRILGRFEQDALGDQRWVYLEYGLDAVRTYFPWGSGAGSFRDVYAPFEPVGAMTTTYALHAHNDLLETTLELGAPGLLLLVCVTICLLLVMRKNLTAATGPDAIIAGVTAVAVLGPLLHSLLDYPLRTLEVAVLFALVVAQLTAMRSDSFHSSGSADVVS
ncbi:O-antigen ligase [Lysobacter niastensis]|uniref:O-antigen ligase n=1 Tax=Lysobacter niastensis TaxID=380629 RepID=A0ABU1WE97_9GAMM|nr:O-antigen ligase family protein [Lysobacter niastensis]MDR7135859.1 O-antigen ligase [Lysobacter niastensis]